MKANDGLRGSLFARQIGRESILGPTLCLCCGPNMICTCLLLCFLPRWAWAALSGGLCQHGDARTAVKTSIPAQNLSINKSFSRNDGAASLPQKQVEGDKIICKVFQSTAMIFHLVLPPLSFFLDCRHCCAFWNLNLFFFSRLKQSDYWLIKGPTSDQFRVYFYWVNVVELTT